MRSAIERDIAAVLGQPSTHQTTRGQRMIGSDATVVSRALDKDAEYEADCIAVVLATCAGYDAYGLQRCCNNPVILHTDYSGAATTRSYCKRRR